jgi:hypothetical protein
MLAPFSSWLTWTAQPHPAQLGFAENYGSHTHLRSTAFTLLPTKAVALTQIKLTDDRLSVGLDAAPQVAEFQLRVAVLNGFTALGTAITEITR